MDYYAELLHLIRKANPTCPILCLVPDATTTSAEVNREGQARTSGRLQENVAAAIARAREHNGIGNVHYEVCISLPFAVFRCICMQYSLYICTFDSAETHTQLDALHLSFPSVR